MFKFEKINNIQIEPVEGGENFDPKKIIGYDYFNQPFCNIFIVARKNSGKTTLIYNILRHIIDPKYKKKQHVHFFVGTIKQDRIYDSIKELLDYNEINYDENDSLYDPSTGDNLVEKMMKEIDDIDKDNYSYAEHIIIFDDLSLELKTANIIPVLMKENRHLKSKIIISSQYITDIIPAARSQVDYCLTFYGLSNRNLYDLYNSLNIWIPEYDTFKELYLAVTKPAYNFLYIDNVLKVFRANFNILIEDHSEVSS